MRHLCYIDILPVSTRKLRSINSPCVWNRDRRRAEKTVRHCLFLFVTTDHALQTVLYHDGAQGMASRRESRSAATGAHTLQEFENREDHRVAWLG
jgi:hypothetical protein